MATRKTIKPYIQQYLREASRYVNIKQAILFGSYAEDRQQRDSDIDLAIVSDDFTDNPIENRKMLSPLSFKFNRIEFHPFTVSYFRKSYPFIKEIKKSGIVIPLKF